ncbi:hypothetical protein C8A00DRAFT_16251 [Chaetomidium leptoderma]|uniref:DUF7707 domain-containing protein n=1 Tax=Chaetomidium leptoderma TaxID=669021 RepID=A0AAN6ZXH3_9PEZI|nr:hypothetical protein C8A00DRAFT_16251 [Chaetomidium leptoderma]
MRQNTLLVALSALTAASAQNFTIDAGTVKPALRSQWCGAEYNTCRLLCGGNPKANDCNVDTLAYTCTCSNGTAPGLEYYIQSIPTFICEQVYSDCIAANTSSSRAQDECTTNIKSKCGTLDPAKAQISNPSTETTKGAGSDPTDAPDASKPANKDSPSASSSTSSSTAAAATNAAYIGNGVAMVAAGVFAAML